MTEDEIIAYANELRQIIRIHEVRRITRTLNLLASQNYANLEIKSCISSDLSNRYIAPVTF
ncbi:MAG TPA: hypothetical protein VJN71_08035 [Nitrososphaerales archaeon]|nr:hypothetical protein [Nitrososphaerales archaeon]